jgi:predicted kinase
MYRKYKNRVCLARTICYRRKRGKRAGENQSEQRQSRRIDSIEQAIRDSGEVSKPLNDVGYRVGYSVAEDNLRLGRSVIADSVNPLQVTRDARIGVADRVAANVMEVEITCSDPKQHQRRVETRIADIDGLRPPKWQEVVEREYQPWNREHIVIDTAGRSVAESVKELREALAK